MISWVIVSYLVFAFLSAETGMVNQGILAPLGREPIVWYQEKRYWPFLLVLAYLLPMFMISSVITVDFSSGSVMNLICFHFPAPSILAAS